MKKYLAYLLIALLGLPIFTPAFAVTSSSVTSSASYKVTVQNIVKKYVQNLDDANYTDTEIITRLETLRAEYTKQKSLSSYRGSRKMKINMIIDAITDMIKEVDNRDTTSDDDLYSIFNQTPTKTTTTTTTYNPPSCTKEARVCSNGSYVYRSGNSCEFTACPVVTTPVSQTNNITGVSAYVINGVLRTDLIAQYPSSLYKEYDIYLFTPTPTNGQPSQKSFIPKPQNLIWNTYNSYTITTNFQSETSLDKVKSIRSLADNSYYMSKQNKTLTKDSLYEIFGFLPDNYFNERAFLSQPNNALYMYATYLLYVAKDNSEAFTVSFNQSGKKKPNTIASNMIVDQNSIGLVGLSFATSIKIKNALYSNYKTYLYTPPAGADLSSVLSTMNNAGLAGNSALNFTYPISRNTTFLYNIVGYSLDQAYVNKMESFFSTVNGGVSGYVNPSNPDGVYKLFFAPVAITYFNQKKLSDNTYRVYSFIVSVDNPKEAYLMEYQQVAAYDY